MRLQMYFTFMFFLLSACGSGDRQSRLLHPNILSKAFQETQIAMDDSTPVESPSTAPSCEVTVVKISTEGDASSTLGNFPNHFGGLKFLGEVKRYLPGNPLTSVLAYRFEASGIYSLSEKFGSRESIVSAFCESTCAGKQWVQSTIRKEYRTAEDQVVGTSLIQDHSGLGWVSRSGFSPTTGTSAFGSDNWVDDHYSESKTCESGGTEHFPGSEINVISQIREDAQGTFANDTPIFHWIDGPGEYGIKTEVTFAEIEGATKYVSVRKIGLKQEFCGDDPTQCMLCKIDIETTVTYRFIGEPFESSIDGLYDPSKSKAVLLGTPSCFSDPTSGLCCQSQDGSYFWDDSASCSSSTTITNQPDCEAANTITRIACPKNSNMACQSLKVDDRCTDILGDSGTCKIGGFGGCYCAVDQKMKVKVGKVGTGSGTIVSTDGRINCGGDCEVEYTEFSTTTVTLTAINDPGSEFIGWIGEDCFGDNLDCTVTISDTEVDILVTAEFTATNSCAAIQDFASCELDTNCCWDFLLNTCGDSGICGPDPTLCPLQSCEPSEICDSATGICEPDPTLCPMQSCEPSEICNSATGICEPDPTLCPMQSCEPSEICDSATGICEPDPTLCPLQSCEPSEICDSATGICESDPTLCPTQSCEFGQVCDTATGICEPDPTL